MSDTTYQNQDLGYTNPIQTEPVITEQSTPSTKSTNKFKFTIPQDPKVRILIILFAIVLILFVVSIPVSIMKNNQPIIRVTPTQAPRVTPLPTESDNFDKFPSELKSMFNSVDQNSQININFNPPQIDTEIGF